MRQAFITVDLGFGDAGKGKVVAALVRKHKSKLVVRYNGGAQAAHNVVDKGVHHTFTQFGAGTFDGAHTLLSRHMLVNPLLMEGEASRLASLGIDGYAVLCVDARAVVTTPYHRAVNRLRELSRGAGRHGSCGVGIGETVADMLVEPDDAVRVGDLRHHSLLMEKLAYCKGRMWEKAVEIPWVDCPEFDRQLSTFQADFPAILERYKRFAELADILTPSQVAELLHETDTVIFEGAQGVLLDENYGFHPYTTWTTTTTANALAILDEAEYRGPTTEVGITRTYATRHGAGPFVTEDAKLTQILPDSHNDTNDWQREFRCGWLDLPMLRYALHVNGSVDCLAVTHVDALEKVQDWKVCYAYQDGFSVCNSLPHPIEVSLAQQEKLGNWLLSTVTPRYWTFEAAHVVGNLVNIAAVPLLLESTGPETDAVRFNDVLQQA